MKTVAFQRLDFSIRFQNCRLSNDSLFFTFFSYSQVGWSFDLFGDIWGVGRNEDGDSTGWGSRTFRTFDGDLSDWKWISGNKVCLIITNIYDGIT